MPTTPFTNKSAEATCSGPIVSATTNGAITRHGFEDVTRACLNLTKPRIIGLLLITTFGGMVMAKRGRPNLELILATLVGGAFAAGGANAINCYLDRDIDRLVSRPRRRAVPAGRISPPCSPRTVCSSTPWCTPPI